MFFTVKCAGPGEFLYLSPQVRGRNTTITHNDTAFRASLYQNDTDLWPLQFPTTNYLMSVTESLTMSCHIACPHTCLTGSLKGRFCASLMMTKHASLTQSMQ